MYFYRSSHVCSDSVSKHFCVARRIPTLVTHKSSAAQSPFRFPHTAQQRIICQAGSLRQRTNIFPSFCINWKRFAYPLPDYLHWSGTVRGFFHTRDTTLDARSSMFVQRQRFEVVILLSGSETRVSVRFRPRGRTT